MVLRSTTVSQTMLSLTQRLQCLSIADLSTFVTSSETSTLTSRTCTMFYSTRFVQRLRGALATRWASTSHARHLTQRRKLVSGVQSTSVSLLTAGCRCPSRSSKHISTSTARKSNNRRRLERFVLVSTFFLCQATLCSLGFHFVRPGSQSSVVAFRPIEGRQSSQDVYALPTP